MTSEQFIGRKPPSQQASIQAGKSEPSYSVFPHHAFHSFFFKISDMGSDRLLEHLLLFFPIRECSGKLAIRFQTTVANKNQVKEPCKAEQAKWEHHHIVANPEFWHSNESSSSCQNSIHNQYQLPSSSRELQNIQDLNRTLLLRN